jgi:glycosyltransferase involved in cell wall biosynthesis
MVKISICIPAYKDVNALQRCLNSIRIQTYNDYEVIVSDDTPGDEVQNLILQYPDLPLHYHKNPQALGSPENWNNAMRLASGEYIKIMHHDDWFAFPGSLEEYVKLMDGHPQSVFGFSGRKDVDIHNHTKEIPRHSNRIEIHNLRKNPDILGLGNLIGAPSVTIFRNHLAVFFDKQLIWLVDIEFYIRMLRQYPDFAYTPKALIVTGFGEDQVTNQVKDNKTLIRAEQEYLDKKLDLKCGRFYLAYHQLKNKFIPQLKKQMRKIWK